VDKSSDENPQISQINADLLHWFLFLNGHNFIDCYHRKVRKERKAQQQ